MSQVFELAHPLGQLYLGQLRDRTTSPPEFRNAMRQLSILLACEATRSLRTRQIEIQTPVGRATGAVLDQSIALVPILRAGLGMVDAMIEFIPTATVWHVGVFRDEETALPVEYYSRIPKSHSVDLALVLDPMLATGGSAAVALRALHESGVRSTKLLSIIAARPGIEVIASEFPETQIHVCAVDRDLNSRKFIVPGLGDAGDRIFNTV